MPIRYLAPELLHVDDEEIYFVNKSFDVWSMAIVIFAVVYKKAPWSNATDDDVDYVVFREDPDLAHDDAWLNMHPLLRACMFDMLSVNHLDRPHMATLAQVLRNIEYFSR